MALSSTTKKYPNSKAICNFRFTKSISSSMGFSLTRLNRVLIQPCEPTPSVMLDLSLIDNIPVLRCFARTIHVFTHAPDAARVIKEALAKALVSYYPLSGRMKELNQGKIQIDCTGKTGIWFVDAVTDFTLESICHFDNLMEIPYDDLLPDQIPEGDNEEPLVQMQVTQFSCGGFVMGLRFSHAICDGLGAAQFLNAVGEIACGRTNLGVSPVWHRDFIPPPPLHRRENDAISPPCPPVFPGYKLEHLSSDIPSDLIERFKHEFHASTGEICSAFEVIAACFWKLRTEAIDLRENTEVKLVFFANCRHLVNPPLPVGFYGNCFFPVKISAGSHEIAKENSVFDVVKLIKQAKAKLPEEFEKFVNGDGDGDDPFAPAVGYTTLFLSEWGKLGFNQVDYGWGPPLHVAPIQGLSIVPAGIVGSMPLPKKGVRLMTWCVEDTHRQLFQDLMTNKILTYNKTE